MNHFASALILILAFSVAAPLAHADDSEVCLIRPDLCDSAQSDSTSEIKARNPATRRPAAIKKVPRRQPQSIAKTTYLAKKSTPSKRCRIAGRSYNLNDVDLPLCEKFTSTQPAKSVAHQNQSAEPSVNFESYLNQNSNHPALLRRAPAQAAFVDRKPRATLEISKGEGGQGFRDNEPTPPSSNNQ